MQGCGGGVGLCIKWSYTTCSGNASPKSHTLTKVPVSVKGNALFRYQLRLGVGIKDSLNNISYFHSLPEPAAKVLLLKTIHTPNTGLGKINLEQIYKLPHEGLTLIVSKEVMQATKGKKQSAVLP